MNEETFETKKWAVSRIKFFLDKLEKAETPEDAETQLYAIKDTATHAEEKVHNANC